MSRFTVVHRQGEVEDVLVVEGDWSDQPDLQTVAAGASFWVAVAMERWAAERWAAAYLDYLTDAPLQRGRHWGRMLELAGAAVPRMRIVPVADSGLLQGNGRGLAAAGR